jgi:hypothetical protein
MPNAVRIVTPGDGWLRHPVAPGPSEGLYARWEILWTPEQETGPGGWFDGDPGDRPFPADLGGFYNNSSGFDPTSPDNAQIVSLDATTGAYAPLQPNRHSDAWGLWWWWGDEVGFPPLPDVWQKFELWLPPEGHGFFKVNSLGLVSNIDAHGHSSFSEGTDYGDMTSFAAGMFNTTGGEIWVGRIQLGTTIRSSDILNFNPATAVDLSSFDVDGVSTMTFEEPPVALPSSIEGTRTSGPATVYGDIRTPYLQWGPTSVHGHTYRGFIEPGLSVSVWPDAPKLYAKIEARWHQADLNAWSQNASNPDGGFDSDAPLFMQLNDDTGPGSENVFLFLTKLGLANGSILAGRPGSGNEETSDTNTCPFTLGGIPYVTDGTEYLVAVVTHNSASTADCSGWAKIGETAVSADGRRLTVFGKQAIVAEPDPTFTFDVVCQNLVNIEPLVGLVEPVVISDSAIGTWQSGTTYDYPSLTGANGTTGVVTFTFDNSFDRAAIVVAVSGLAIDDLPPLDALLYFTSTIGSVDDVSFPATVGTETIEIDNSRVFGFGADWINSLYVLTQYPASIFTAWEDGISSRDDLYLAAPAPGDWRVLEIYLDPTTPATPGYYRVDGVEVDTPAIGWSDIFKSVYVGLIEADRNSQGTAGVDEIFFDQEGTIEIRRFIVGTTDGGSDVLDWNASVASVLGDDLLVHGRVERGPVSGFHVASSY